MNADVNLQKDIDIVPFWNNNTSTLSKNLWIPNNLLVTVQDESFRKLLSNTWYSANVFRNSTDTKISTCLETIQTNLPKLQQLEKTYKLELKTRKPKQTEIGGVYKIKLNLSNIQKNTLKSWFGLQRWVYNRCLEYIKNNKKYTIKSLRAAVINDINFENNNQWVKKYHYDLRDEALRDCLKNISSNIAKGDKFSMKFKSRKNEHRTNTSLSVLKKHWNKKNNFYSKIFKPSLLNAKEILPEKLLYDTRIIKTPLNKYYICLQNPKVVNENQVQKDNMIFFDPGLKTFLTGYDPSGRIVTIGNKDCVKRIAILLHFKRRLQSKLSMTTGHKKNKLRIAMLRINTKIHNLVTDLHKKASKWICENYKNAYLPRLNFHKCKKLNKKSKALLASFRHCEFLETLLKRTQFMKSCNVYEVNESYTSKTCSNCGCQKENLRNKDIYNCDGCKLTIGRDINASKNVMLRYFTKRAIIDSLVA